MPWPPMRTWPFLLLVIASGCADPAAPVSENDRQLHAKWDAWYQLQVAQDCPSPPYDATALKAVQDAHRRQPRQYVFGPADPYDRRPDTLDHVKTRSNRRGDGVIVTAWADRNRGGGADYSRHRSVWLVLDGRVYPLNTSAAGDVGRLFDGLPATIQKRAGLTDTSERRATMMDQIGIEEHTFERRFSGGNPFPMCP